jgi:hypothetical protein
MKRKRRALEGKPIFLLNTFAGPTDLLSSLKISFEISLGICWLAQHYPGNGKLGQATESYGSSEELKKTVDPQKKACRRAAEIIQRQHKLLQMVLRFR